MSAIKSLVVVQLFDWKYMSYSATKGDKRFEKNE